MPFRHCRVLNSRLIALQFSTAVFRATQAIIASSSGAYCCIRVSNRGACSTRVRATHCMIAAGRVQACFVRCRTSLAEIAIKVLATVRVIPIDTGGSSKIHFCFAAELAHHPEYKRVVFRTIPPCVLHALKARPHLRSAINLARRRGACLDVAVFAFPISGTEFATSVIID